MLEGRHNQSLAQITQALAISRGAPLLLVDLKSTRTRLEKLPWIRMASVEREFPDTLRVRIAERRPLALWQRQQPSSPRRSFYARCTLKLRDASEGCTDGSWQAKNLVVAVAAGEAVMPKRVPQRDKNVSS